VKLSIITINLNNAKGLQKTIESVVNQTFKDLEYIVIDGGSTDGSVEIIKKYADKINYWISEPDTGIYNAMNKGIAVAKGEYLQFLNSGDWLYSSSILENVFSLNRNEDLLYGNIVTYKGENKCIPDIYPNEITAFRLFNTTICHQSIFHKKKLFEKNYYNEKNRVVSDWEFLLQTVIVNNCSTYKINEFIVYLDGIDSKNWGKLIQEERAIVLKNYFPQRIINDYEFFTSLINDPLFHFLSILHPYAKLKKSVKLFIKILLSMIRKKHLLTKSPY